MELGLKDKSVLVTGGGSNIGRAIVLAFAVEDAHITIADLDVSQAEKTAESARRAGAASVQVVRTDVTRLVQVQAAFRSAADRHGGVDVLVNNVGLLNCAKTALDLMIERGGDAIVAVGSDASRQGEPREAVYAGVKAAVNAFMKTIAKENGRHGIRCNVVCPGVTVPNSADDIGAGSVWADSANTFTPEQIEKIAKSLPMRKVGRGSDIAQAVVFLSSALAAGHVTGQVLSVSGGHSMIG